MSENVVDKFLRYVKINTQSDENSITHPSTNSQKSLAKILRDELKEIGANDVYLDEEKCYVYAKIPATDGGRNPDTIGFISHMDTSPECSGENVNPRIIDNYDGKDIVLNEEKGIVTKTSTFSELENYVEKTLIVTDGNTLLGADDKAGIAEIITAAEFLISHKEIPHGEISIAFTPDEEIGVGVDNFDLDRFGANYAFTIDGGGIGELEYENFNAASAKITFHGVNVHTGEAKGKMINAAQLACEFECAMPKLEKPEFTEGYEGFFHLENIKGSVENAELSYLIRDHNKENFENRKKLVENLSQNFNDRFGQNTVTSEIKDTYYNMKEKIDPDFMFLIDKAKTAMQELGITPKIQPIRGGTDGASLSFKGLPCPNICTGGHNFHGRHEYVCTQSMEQIVKLIVRIVTTDI